MAYRSFGRSWQARHPPRYAASLSPPSPSFGHSSWLEGGYDKKTQGHLEAAVVAAPHPQLGEDIRAFVALRPGMRAEPEELRNHCAERLSPHKVPRDIRLIEALPRNSMGKVQKAALRRSS